MADKCVWCGAKQVLTRVDTPHDGGWGDPSPRTQGLGIVMCPSAECRAEHESLGPEAARMSPGRAFVQHVKDHMAVGRKWTVRHDGYVGSALNLAIRSGMEFFPWDGEYLGFHEAFYCLACTTSGDIYRHSRNPANTSAARAMEQMWGRPPFVLGGKRLCEGSTFWWAEAGRDLTVTSFRSKGDAKVHYANCAKRERVEGSQYGETKNVGFVKITPAELRSAAKAGNALWATRG